MKTLHIFDSWVLALNYATHEQGHHSITTHATTANAHYWSVS